MKTEPLSIVTTIKAMTGHFAVIQKNALTSWTRLKPKCQVMVAGNAEGSAQLARDLGLDHIDNVACNQWQTPFLKDIIQKAEKAARHERIMLINADIILGSEFLAAVARAASPQTLIIGGRWNIDLTGAIDFGSDSWEQRLKEKVRRQGKLMKGALDYFIFPRGFWGTLPEQLAIGRPGYDNFLVYQARKTGRRVVDITGAVTAIHQNHDYSHHRDGWQGVWQGPEARQNYACQESIHPDHPEIIFRYDDATHCLTTKGLAINPLRTVRDRIRAEICPTTYGGLDAEPRPDQPTQGC